MKCHAADCMPSWNIAGTCHTTKATAAASQQNTGCSEQSAETLLTRGMAIASFALRSAAHPARSEAERWS